MIRSLNATQETGVCAIDKSCCGRDEPASSCTLDPTELPERVERWQSLFTQVTRYTVGAISAEFRFANSDRVRDELTELVKLERACFAHVSWEMSRSGDQQILTMFSEEQALLELITLLIPSQPERLIQ